MSDLNRIELRGLVVAAAWKANGEVAAVDIAGYDEKRYRVADDGMGKSLRAHLKMRVIIDGLAEQRGDAVVVHVVGFRIDPSP